MNKLEQINQIASKLTVEEINNFSDEEILALTMQRPGHPGQVGFMFSMQNFNSVEHFAKIMAVLMKRLTRIK